MFRVYTVVICEDIICLFLRYIHIFRYVSENIWNTDRYDVRTAKWPNWLLNWNQFKGLSVAELFGSLLCLCLLFFFSSAELLERHISCNVPPSHQNHELFLLPINPLIPSVFHCFILSFPLAYTHFTPSFSWLWLLPQTRWKPSTSQPPSCWEEERFHAFLTFTLVSSQVCNFHHWVGGQSRKRKPGYRLCFSLLHYVFCIFACFYLFSHEPSFMFISFSGAYSTLLASLIGSNQNH